MGKSSEGATALCWAGFKLYWLTALKLWWPFLLRITCVWNLSQRKWGGEKPHHTQVQTQAESKISAPNSRTNRIQCRSLSCCSPVKPAVPRGGWCSSLGGGDGVWAWFKTGRCWWEPAKRRVKRSRASDADLRASVCITTGCVGTASLLWKHASPTPTPHALKPSTSPREEQWAAP